MHFIFMILFLMSFYISQVILSLHFYLTFVPLFLELVYFVQLWPSNFYFLAHCIVCLLQTSCKVSSVMYLKLKLICSPFLFILFVLLMKLMKMCLNWMDIVNFLCSSNLTIVYLFLIDVTSKLPMSVHGLQCFGNRKCCRASMSHAGGAVTSEAFSQLV